jgi:hypothetical protein
MVFDMKVEYAVGQIQNFLAKQKTTGQESIDRGAQPNSRPNNK